MTDVAVADDALRVVLAPNPSPMTLDGTRTYVVGRSRPVVIDPGPALDGHLAAIETALGGVCLGAIVLTHGHADHSAAVPELARRTGAPVLMGRGALRAGLPASAVTRWIAHGDVVESDAGPLRAIATPGHAPEHLAFHWSQGAEGGAVFVGDHLMGVGDTTLVAPPEGDLADYLESLERIRAAGAGTLYPAHGPPITDAEAALDRYAEHRRVRIEQVYDALRKGGAARPGGLVRRVYGPELDPALAQAAEGSVRAILGYLERKGRVKRRLLGLYSITG
ncbi:MAG: MBL fold metallo-hydrolase [Gemmatimonadetes bacterium]|nr:MBL fold metallo-hydrolase [Gemmatimonadota bacterium]